MELKCLFLVLPNALRRLSLSFFVSVKTWLDNYFKLKRAKHASGMSARRMNGCYVIHHHH